MALQFCIEELLRRAHGPCGFYLITIPHVMGWKEVSKRHALMLDRMRTDSWKGRIKRFGGVRVFEEGETTFRPHAHWVMTPRFSQSRVQHYASIVGLGHVWLDPRPAGQYLGMYLSKYLSKGKALKGVRRWSCFGEFESVKVREVEVTSPEIELFRSHFADCKKEGLSGQQAYTETVRRCNVSKYGMYLDTEQVNPFTAKIEQRPVYSESNTDVTLITNLPDGQILTKRL